MSQIGQPISRVDGRAKVTGSATYAAEFHPEGLCYAALVHATIPRGTIRAIDTQEAEAMRDVLRVITHENAPRLAWEHIDPPLVDPDEGQQIRPFQSAQVLFAGQPVAMVVAATQEAARAAAARVKVSYEQTQGAGLVFDKERGRPPKEATQESYPAESGRGDVDSALANAAVKVEIDSLQPRIHHNAMEPHATIASWEGQDRLTLWDKTQWVDNARTQIARNFGLPEEAVRVISPFVGGAFGSALRCWPHTTMAAMAAKVLGRPVRLELTRRELYASVGYRPETFQTVQIGADADGRLQALRQEAFGQTSTYEDYGEETLVPPQMLYDVPNAKTVYRLVEMDTNTPTSMRGPGAVTGILATETAMDELAQALDIDPLELRLRNYAERDQAKDLPWSSKELRACYETAARKFGWERRRREPGSMRAGQKLVGYGMATAAWPGMRAPAEVKVKLFDNGTAVVQSAASDMGPGTYTSMTQVAADRLGLPIDKVRFELGDTDLPQAPVHGGSITMASIGNAVVAGCEALREKLGARDGDGASLVEALRRSGQHHVEVQGSAKPGKESQTHSTFAFGAVFVEVQVDPDFGTITVPRVVGAYDGGLIVNPKTARSQAIGGMVQGIGMALMEGAEWDSTLGRVMNANFAEYLVPVNADIQELEAVFVPSEDKIFNPLGVKGIAEIALAGVAPAIVNAVWHATGVRLRELPLTPDRLIMAWQKGSAPTH